MILGILLVAYALVLVGLGIFVSRTVRGSTDFFVAGRAMPGWLVFATLLAANIGAGSTVGAAGLGYRHGLSAWWWSGSAAIGSVILGLVVAPRLHRLAAERGFLTVGDFLEARFDGSLRGIVATLLCLGSLSILAGQLIAMAWAFNVVLGLPKLSGCLLAGAVLVAYFSRGGLVASAWVNLLELAVLLTGFVLALPYAWSAAGGWEAMRRAAGSESSQAFGSFVGMGWGPILGLSLILVPSFIVSPGLVQKTFGARSARAARWAVLANAAALAVFAFIPATLGMCARALRPDLAHPELALPALMSQVLPPWVGGLALAALFAAEISTADAVLFMLSTSFSRDLYQRFLRPGARTATFSERRLSSTSEAGLTPGEEFDDGGAGARTAAFSERRLSSTSEAGLTPSEEFDDGGAGARTPIDDDADDARLLKVGRWTSAVSGFVGVALAVLLPSVVDALKVFYGIMTVALFVPLLGGLLLPKPTAARARAAVWAGTLSMAVCLVVFRGSALASWLPVAVGIALAAGVFMWRGIGKA